MAVTFLLVLSVAIGIVVLYVLFINGVRSNLTNIDSVAGVQTALQQVFAGVLLILMGLELIETLKTYFAEHAVRIEVILIIALIAVGRHVVQVDVVHLSGATLAGMAALIIALSLSYFLVKKAHIAFGRPPES
jgi:uncharacterized membrane protein (DUF373 family)